MEIYNSEKVTVDTDIGIAAGCSTYKIYPSQVKSIVSEYGYKAKNIKIDKINSNKYTWKCDLDI